MISKLIGWCKNHRDTVIIGIIITVVGGLILAGGVAMFQFVSARLGQLATSKDLDDKLTSNNQKLTASLNETASKAAKAEAQRVRDEMQKQIKLVEKDNKRMLCLICRRSKDLKNDSLCLENGCNYRASIRHDGKQLTVPVLPLERGDGEVQTASATNKPAPVKVYIQNGSSVEEVIANDFTFASSSPSGGDYKSFVIDKKYLPGTWSDARWDEFVKGVKTNKGGGKIYMESSVPPPKENQ